ncbi:hypothetical protein TcasGA2_TC001534 [Tribolium castaneum]|uniref:Uncharacterized protein n=1 Tax=Tribolium castaneum TaxID=7070 RepID=D7EI52_TRICA|nr:hypothetical protein TcasGA2_TC001534 [Tribolium castaneum]
MNLKALEINKISVALQRAKFNKPLDKTRNRPAISKLSIFFKKAIIAGCQHENNDTNPKQKEKRRVNSVPPMFSTGITQKPMLVGREKYFGGKMPKSNLTHIVFRVIEDLDKNNLHFFYRRGAFSTIFLFYRPKIEIVYYMTRVGSNILRTSEESCTRAARRVQ